MFKEFDVFFDEVNQCYQIRTKANSFAIDFDDDSKKEVFERVLKLDSSSLAKSYQLLIKEFDQSKVIDVFSTLKDNGLLPLEELDSIPELQEKKTADFGAQQELTSLEDLSVLILSDGVIGERLKEVLKRNNVTKITHLSPEEFASKSEEKIEQLVKGSSFSFFDATSWNPKGLELMNTKALEYKKTWLHIGGLEEYLFKIGPIFQGDETGCYDCLMKRMKSNYDHSDYLNEYEKYLKEMGKSAKPDKFIHLDSFYDILANMAFIELTKFIQFWAVPTTWKKVITINALDFQTTSHDLLKVPFCDTCGTHVDFNPAPWLEPLKV